jgi:hypothetical protein
MAGPIGRALTVGVVVSFLSCPDVQAQSAVSTSPTSEQVEVRGMRIQMSSPGQDGAAGPSVAWAPMAHAQMDFDIVAGPLDLGGAVKGAPYSAEAVSEVVQTLADGNRIVRSSASAFYRDGAGRTRREEGLAVIGPLVGAPDQMKRVIITDPELGVTYVLDSATRTARRMQLPAFGAARFPLPPPPPSPPIGADVVFFETAVAPAAAGASVMKMFAARRMDGAQNEKSEPLGTQTFDGVVADGTRSTVTIPAGQIGNERPIDIVSERWFSPDLKTLVLSRQSDPRFGETTYRLSNIVRGEPDPSLFEVPSDYQILEGGGAGDMLFRKELRN